MLSNAFERALQIDGVDFSQPVIMPRSGLLVEEPEDCTGVAKVTTTKVAAFMCGEPDVTVTQLRKYIATDPRVENAFALFENTALGYRGSTYTSRLLASMIKERREAAAN